MEKDYYNILGVKKTASADEIKTAFRKLSLKYHPDRQGGKSEKEKKEAEQKFKEINEAYQCLSDETKRQNYDNGGNSTNGFGDDFGFADFFRNASRRGSGHFNTGFDFSDFIRENATHKTVIQGKSIKMVVPVSITEIFNGGHKTLKFDVNKRCPNCHGAGGHNECSCQDCHGTGYITKITRAFGSMMRQETVCPKCGGTGKTFKTKCASCNGTGFRTASTTLEIDIPTGVENGGSMIFKGKGCESPQIEGMNGDFIVVFNYQYDEEKYTIVGHDVVEKVYVDYYDLLLGCEIEITLPSNKKKKIVLESCTKDGTLIKLFGEGIPIVPDLNINNIPAHDYYLEIHYKMPVKLSDTERKHIESIKVDRYKETMKEKLENN